MEQFHLRFSLLEDHIVNSMAVRRIHKLELEFIFLEQILKCETTGTDAEHTVQNTTPTNDDRVTFENTISRIVMALR